MNLELCNEVLIRLRSVVLTCFLVAADWTLKIPRDTVSIVLLYNGSFLELGGPYRENQNSMPFTIFSLNY